MALDVTLVTFHCCPLKCPASGADIWAVSLPAAAACHPLRMKPGFGCLWAPEGLLGLLRQVVSRAQSCWKGVMEKLWSAMRSFCSGMDVPFHYLELTMANVSCGGQSAHLSKDMSRHLVWEDTLNECMDQREAQLCGEDKVLSECEWGADLNDLEASLAPRGLTSDNSDLEDETDNSEWSESDWEDEDEESEDSSVLWNSFFQNDLHNPFRLCSPEMAKVPKIRDDVQEQGGKLSDGQDLQRRDEKTTKKVRFSDVVQVRPLVVWAHAARAARNGECWQAMARDRARFQRRVQQVGELISPCLQPEHRKKVLEKMGLGAAGS
ncbi:protein phosphatase 1 regulatory subunit 15A [Erpetoichthys calabaricus]|uniref:protein phosphatase 1 regulatory subunit 15A n=1 Tax=Erpetoichthys calabaricus TaxID=27687 RepID=UPI002234727E|nr:protein phosphatase 1 regulatory subunit 15A [Erpetoichthys calabaricus]